MGRRRQSTARDIMELVALLPWWLGLVLALVSYLVSHGLSVPPPAPVGTPLADFIVRTVVAGIATWAQYVLPALCCLGVLGSVLRRRHRAALLDGAAGGAAGQLAAMSWRDFELLVGEAYRLDGYVVTEAGGGGADGGVDLMLRRGGETVFVQCKHWRTRRVGVPVIRELVGVMAARGASRGVVVTGGGFTPEARAFAGECNVDLIDGPALDRLLKQAKASRSGAQQSVRRSTADLPSGAQAGDAPECPVCQAWMVRRMARKGAAAGAQFWGCSRFPACRGTR